MSSVYASIIVPVFNEEDNIGILHDELTETMSDLNLSYEILYVDDGSNDGSCSILEGLAKRDVRNKLIRLGRNYGQTAAIGIGIEHAQGAVIVTMDADLQNDPSDIPLLLTKLKEGYDIVSGWRKHRQDKLLTRVVPSRIANKLISDITQVSLHDYGCTLKAYRQEAIKSIRLYGEMHRFIPAYAALDGARICEVAVHHRPRYAGKSKYGLSRMVNVLLDLFVIKFLFGYSTKPFRLFGGVGLVCCLGGFLFGSIAVYEAFVHELLFYKNPLFSLAIFLVIIGIHFNLMGLLAELIGRTYYQTQNRPNLYIAKMVNIETKSRPNILGRY